MLPLIAIRTCDISGDDAKELVKKKSGRRHVDKYRRERVRKLAQREHKTRGTARPGSMFGRTCRTILPP